MAGVAIALKTLFIVLGSLMVATLIYTIYIDGLPFRSELLTPWMATTLIDFYINIGAIGAWVFYKESSWIMALIWIVLLVCFGRGIGAVIYRVPELENDQMLKISLRSLDIEDTTSVSQKFGGGGHRNASSFLLSCAELEQWKVCSNSSQVV